MLPNLGIILMWPIGGPPMRVGLVLFGVGALIASQLPWRRVKMAVLGALSAVVMTLYICNTFAIPTLNFPLIAQFLVDVRPFRSPEYLLAGAVILFSAGLAIHRAPSVPRFTSPIHFLFALLALSPDTPPTDILIVGDHKPPFFDRVSRLRFDPDHVPWIYLKAKNRPAAPSRFR